ncbi:MAG: hypothetical protein HXM38_01765 [Isoptericola variabilis]|nr:hypothetical protein [Isoptericola variabilis]
MNKCRIYSSFALIVLAFSTAITIIEFIHFNNQTWHRIACFFLLPLLALLIAVFVAALIFAPRIDKQGKQPSKTQKIEAQDNDSTQSKGSNTDTQSTTRQTTPEGKQDKTPENQSMQTTPTMQESKVSYKSTFVEYTASNSGNYHQGTNEAAENAEQSNKGEQTS